MIEPREPRGYVSIDDFKKLDMRVGKIVSVDRLPKAEKLYRIRVDIGGGIVKQAVVSLVGYYAQEELRGKKIIFLANLQPKKFMGETSEGMPLAAEREGKVVLLTTDRDISEGAKVT